MARNGFHVIDIHHHVGRVTSFGDLLAGADESSDTFGDTAEVEARLAVMDANGVDQSVVIPGHDYPRPNGRADTAATNDAIAAYRDRYPERFPAAVGIVEPSHGAFAVAELERMSIQLGLAGVSFHARFQGVSNDSPLLHELGRRAIDLGLVPFVHAIAESSDEGPLKILPLTESRPDAAIVVLDGFSGFERTKECAQLAALAPNVVFDTSLPCSFDFVESFVDRFGPERVVFGTDLYSAPLAYRRAWALDQLLDSRLDDDSKAMVLAGNARRILGIGD